MAQTLSESDLREMAEMIKNLEGATCIPLDQQWKDKIITGAEYARKRSLAGCLVVAFHDTIEERRAAWRRLVGEMHPFSGAIVLEAQARVKEYGRQKLLGH